MKKVILCSLLLPLLAGCALMSGRTYVEPRDYDLTLAKAPEIDARIEVGGFRNLSGTDRRFLFREKNGEMMTDDYNRWILSPDQLLMRKFYEAFDDDVSKMKWIRINMTVYCFEFDRAENKAKLGVSYNLHFKRRGTSTFDFSTEEPVTGDGYAAAMSKCVDRLMIQIAEETKK